MSLPVIANARLISQQIAETNYTKVKELVGYMGAIQSQDYAMSKWAIGLRLPGATEKDVEKALDKGEIIRTHVLRPTWHIIPAADIYWMLLFSAGKIKTLMKTMDKQLELTEKIFIKSNTVIEKCVAGGKHTDRDAIGACLEKAGIPLGKNRLAHLLIRAELEQIICSGKTLAGKKTYALLAERVPAKKTYSREESLALLAKRYFTSRGPATVADFSWWAGITLTEARSALEMIKSDLITEKTGAPIYWFSADTVLPAKNNSSVYLLPAYDEFIISYKDRTASLAAAHQKKALTANGIFHPVVIVNGQAAGLWKRSFQKDKVNIDISSFQSHNKATKAAITKHAAGLGNFLKKEVLVSFDKSELHDK